MLEPYTEKSDFKHNGERVVTGQRLMQAASDQFLGWLRIEALGRPYDFYVRQLRDWKWSYDIESGDEKQLSRYARYCALALARAHARSGSASAIAGYLGKSDAFERAIESSLSAMQDRPARSRRAAQAEADGQIEVRHGV